MQNAKWKINESALRTPQFYILRFTFYTHLYGVTLLVLQYTSWLLNKNTAFSS